jgi:hypothetical protein
MQIEIYLYLFNNYKINLDFQGMTKYVFSYIISQIKNYVAIFTKMGIYGGDNRSGQFRFVRVGLLWFSRRNRVESDQGQINLYIIFLYFILILIAS